MKKIILAMSVLLLLCGCEKGAEMPSEISESTQSMTAVEEVTAASEMTVTTVSVTTVTTSETTTAPTETIAEETTVTELKLPEPILPPEALKIDVGSLYKDEKYDFSYTILDEENIFILFTFKDGDKVTADGRIFGISDGEEKANIDIPVTEADTFFIRNTAYFDDENILCEIYGCYWDEDMYIERTCTAVNNDLSYSTDFTRSGFWDNAQCRLPNGRRIKITDYGNIYEITEDGKQ